MSELKKEFKSYMEDVEKNIHNKQDAEYIKGRTVELMDAISNEIERILNLKEEKISQIEKKQVMLEERLNAIQEEMNDIEQELLIEEDEEASDEIDEIAEEAGEYDFEITCPYCDYDFIVDLNTDKSEVVCPECNNVIELDWTGNVEENEQYNQGCGNGHCSGCHGCGRMNDEEDDM